MLMSRSKNWRKEKHMFSKSELLTLQELVDHLIFQSQYLSMQDQVCVFQVLKEENSIQHQIIKSHIVVCISLSGNVRSFS